MPFQYKNYRLESKPNKSPDTKKWSATIEISKLDKNGTYNSLPFHIKTTFNTKEEADARAYTFGKEIIDGLHPDCLLPF